MEDNMAIRSFHAIEKTKRRAETPPAYKNGRSITVRGVIPGGGTMSERRTYYGTWAKAPTPIPLSACERIIDTDVLVVGAGMAGMFCAYSAAEQGSRVTVLEKSGSYSGRGFNIGVVNSDLMAERGIFNDADEIVREWIKRCGNRCDETIVRRFAEKSPEAMNWLLEIVTRPEYALRPELNGCVYRGETYREVYGTHIFFDGPISRQGKFGGMNDVLETLYRESLKKGAEFLFHTPMLQLLQEEDGRVTGAVAKDSEGRFVAVRATAGVVLATGDIGGNDEMCEELAPIANRCAVKLCWQNGSSNGDGHRAAIWAGAQIEDPPFPTMIHPQANRHASFCFLFVRQDGSRFMNEDSYLQGRSLGIIKTGEKYVWSVFDSDWRTKVPATLPYGGGLYWGQDFPLGRREEYSVEQEQVTIDWGIRSGVTVVADTPEALAEKMGVDQKGFAATFRRYNEMCRAGRDAEFGKRPELLIPLDKPPYYARKIGAALLAVVGGLRVDADMRVLREADGKPIPGLYAIGNASGGRYGVDYPMLLPGNSIGFALTFGYLVGRRLADLSRGSGS